MVEAFMTMEYYMTVMRTNHLTRASQKLFFFADDIFSSARAP